MTELDPRIEVVRQKYGLNQDDFWKLPQGKNVWLVKHAALEVVAVKADIRFDMPAILEANSSEGIAAVAVQATMGGDRFEWSIGECSPKNNRNAYPWAMAEKRAKDRVILKLIGIHGLVYSEDEMSDVPDAPKVLVKDQREIDGALRDEIDACLTVEDLERLWRSPQFQAEYKKIKPDWQTMLVDHFKEHKEFLLKRPAAIPPNFDGAQQQ